MSKAFRRQDSHKKKRLGGGEWRKPKGVQSKLRIAIWGKGNMPSAGYGTPKKERGLLPNGKRGVRVTHMPQLEKIEKDTECIILAHTLGKKKQAMILARAQELGLTVYNAKVGQ